MKVSKTLDFILNKSFNQKCRTCVHLRGVPNRGRNVKFYCHEKVAQFPFAKDCPKWQVEWTDGTSQSVTIGDYIAQQAGLIKPKKDI